MLEEHKEELKDLQRDLLELYDQEENLGFSKSLLTLVEGRISDLESMIAIDKYWENR
jgi:hypothetical protein